MINIPKGTKDVLPYDSHKWQYVESVALEVCRQFNALQIRTPVFEHTELFLRSIGEGTDVVSKEMYTFNDKGGRSITLKPEGTAPVARCFVENSLDAKYLPIKMFYFTPVFRYEQPQAGRLREHHQFGVEVYGSASPHMDLDVISLAYAFLTKLGITGLTLNLNSIGCPECRGSYVEALRAYLKPLEGDMCPTCRERLKTNPLRVLDCKVDACKKIMSNAPQIMDHICSDCKEHMDTLTDGLSKAKIPYIINSSIVRGLDYYTKTVFEFVTDALGSQGTVCGGGRYDNLVQSVGGKPTPCVGFGLGLERLIMLMDALNIQFPTDKLKLFVMPQSSECFDKAYEIVRNMRNKGVSADTDLTGRSLKSQFRFADKIGAEYSLVIGQSELETGVAKLKRMSDGEEKQININDTDKFYEELR